MKPSLIVLDDFLTNPDEVRQFALSLEFGVKGNYPGARTVSFASKEIKDYMDSKLSGLIGKITSWPMQPEDYNGSFQYATSRDRTWIHVDSNNNWAGVLYLTPNAPLSSGTAIYRHKKHNIVRNWVHKSPYSEQVNKELGDDSQDYTKWEVVDRVGNVYNRIVLFDSTQYHASVDYFGQNKEDSRLFQVFFFDTDIK